MVREELILSISREFFRTKGNFAEEVPHQKNIAVIGLGRECGATFVASSLAFFFSEKGKRVTFTECMDASRVNSCIYEAAAFEKRFFARKYMEFFDKLRHGEALRDVKNEESGVNWQVLSSKNIKDKLVFSEIKKGRIISQARSEICIFDVDFDKAWIPFLYDMDAVVAVIDPKPSKIASNIERFKKMKALEFAFNALEKDKTRFFWIVNHVSSAINKRNIKTFLKSESVFWLNEIESKEFYADEYLCRFHWENELIKSEIKPILEKLFS